MIDHRSDDTIDPHRTSWARLLGDHDRIARQCATLAAVARRPDRPVETASILLLELAVVVADHMGVEDQVIDMTCAAISTGTTPAEATAMAAELERLKADWTRFIVRWNHPTIERDWPIFGEAAEAMLSRLAAQVRRENELLYAEALRRGIIDSGQPVLH